MDKEKQLKELEQTNEFKGAAKALIYLMVQSMYIFTVLIGWAIFKVKFMLFLFVTSIPVLLVVLYYFGISYKELKDKVKKVSK